MDPRMYPLATYLRELRQDWPLHTIQTTLSDVGAYPYDRVAIAAVRAAVDPNVDSPKAIPGLVRRAAGGGKGPQIPPLCAICHQAHLPDEAHLPVQDPGDYARGATIARDALRVALDSAKYPDPLHVGQVLDEQLPIDHQEAM